MDFIDAAEPASQESIDAPSVALSSDPQMPDAFRRDVARLDDVSQRPITEHADLYDAVHRDLRAALDDAHQRG